MDRKGFLILYYITNTRVAPSYCYDFPQLNRLNLPKYPINKTGTSTEQCTNTLRCTK